MNAGRLIRNAEIGGRAGLDLRLHEGRIVEIGSALAGEEAFDARGGAVLPGLADHHIHLLALAARMESVALDDATGPDDLSARIGAATAQSPKGAWVRAVGYHERIAGDLDRAALDLLAPDHRLRVQHQSGKLWALNSAALEAVLHEGAPDCVERDAHGVPTGRIWRGDAWLGARIGRRAPDLRGVGRELLALGVTAVTDASATTDDEAAILLAQARRSGALPQRLRLMSAGAIAPSTDDAFAAGEVKVLLDEDDLPALDALLSRIESAREWGRGVAFHCVSAAELAFALAALEAAGRPAGARIEHGSVIPAGMIARLRDIGATVVTQPVLIADRGDRYLADMPREEHCDLYRVRSLAAAGVAVAASSDAPYGSPDPWRAIAAAASRETMRGARVAPDEAVAPVAALDLYLGALAAPASPRRVEVGAVADLCVLRAPLAEALGAPSKAAVAATFIGGEALYTA